MNGIPELIAPEESAPINFSAVPDDLRITSCMPGYRILPAADLLVARFDGGGASRILRLSPENLSVAWSSRQPVSPGERIGMRLDVGQQTRMPLLAEVTGVTLATGGERELSVRLVSPELHEGRSILGICEDLLEMGLARPPETRAAIRESIQGAARVREVAAGLARERVRGILHSQFTAPFAIRAVDFDEIPGRLVWESDGPKVPAPFMVEGHGFNSVFQIPVEDATFDRRVVNTLLPDQITRVRNRWRRRAFAQAESMVAFNHPLWPQLQILRPLRDMSYNGLSFVTDPRIDVMYPGLMVPEVRVLLPGRPALLMSGEVRSIVEDRDGRRICGMHLRPRSAGANTNWRERVNEVLHPTTQIGSKWCEDSWDLFEASGYFTLSGKDPTKFTEIKNAFVDVGRRLDGAEYVGFRAVWPSTRGVEASISVLKVYSGSWLGHQMAKRPGAVPTGASAKQVLRDIYLRAHEPLQADPDFRWLIGYCEASVRWMNAAHTEFARPFEASGRACSTPFTLMEGATDESTWPVVPGFTIARAREPERLLVLDAIARQKSHIYREALDLVPDRLDLATSRKHWRRAHLQLEREVIVARREEDGRVVAAAIVETAERGTNLFHLLDSVRLFAVDAAAETAEVERAFSALLGGAATWFRARACERFVYFHETELTLHTAPLTNLGGGRFWVIARELLPEFLDHIHRLTGVSRATAAPAVTLPAASMTSVAIPL